MESFVYVDTGQLPIKLTVKHMEALNRQRRILVQFDVTGGVPEMLGMDLDKLIAFTFQFADEKGSQIDSLIWDCDYFIVNEDNANHPGILKWQEQGLDVVQLLLEEARKRGLENIWNHRIAEVDVDHENSGLGMKRKNPVKAAHPDWVVKSWWWQGLWNLASPGLRSYKLDFLRGLADKYPLDGIQLDFSRHVPCLPPGQQWEHRDHATEFVRMVRVMLLEMEEKYQRPMLLAAKVPENLQGCRIDGLDVEAWVQQELVDILSLGSRTMTADLPAFRALAASRNIKLYPCLDDHHATDGYRYPPIAFFRGVFGNWLQQGADGVETFNWSSATDEVYAQTGAAHFLGRPLSQQQAYHEVGSLKTMQGKDKIFAVERRGGYPWAEGYFNRNDGAPLPATLHNDGRITAFRVDVCDDLTFHQASVEKVWMTLILSEADKGDQLEVRVNGTAAAIERCDPEWKDPQLFFPHPQPPSGGSGRYEINPKQRLLMLAVPLAPESLQVGTNSIGIRVLERLPYLPGKDIIVEKLEVTVQYNQ